MSPLLFLSGLTAGGFGGFLVGAWLTWQAGQAKMAELRHANELEHERMERLNRWREEAIRRAWSPDLVASNAVLVEKPKAMGIVRKTPVTA